MVTYSDISLNLQSHPATFDIAKKLDVDAVKASMKYILMASPFDSPFDPNFGGNFKHMLFELITQSTIAVIKKKIMYALFEYEPRVVIEDLYVGEDVTGNGIDIGILFHVIGNPDKQTLNFSMERVR
jgi:phage baseplate assembly protein W